MSDCKQIFEREEMNCFFFFLCCSCLSFPSQLPHVNDASASLLMPLFGLAAAERRVISRVGRRSFRKGGVDVRRRGWLQVYIKRFHVYLPEEIRRKHPLRLLRAAKYAAAPSEGAPASAPDALLSNS